MGDDPKTSVVDRNCRLHDAENVYVVDASVHVTNGGFNPVLTILALAYRASANLVKDWKNTRGRS
jgi:choline dehydrogenase-like flavoprotein